MNQTARANLVARIRMRNDLLSKGVTKETADTIFAAFRKAGEESIRFATENLDAFRDDFSKREMTVGDVPNYAAYDIWSDDDCVLFEYSSDEYRRHETFLIRNLPVKSVEGNKIVVDMWEYDIENHIRKRYRALETRKALREAKAYLMTPFAKEWMEKMQYTVREDEYGHKFVFLAILCGYKKIPQESFSKLCNAISYVHFGHRLSMNMHIAGKVNWTMFYERPDHVNGHETYFCGVVAEDDFSPEDFARNHTEYSFKNAKCH